MFVIRIRVLILMWVLLLAVTTLINGCSGRRLQYDRGTFRFDWRKRDTVSAERRTKFEHQFQRDVELLQVKLQDDAILDAVRQSNERHRGISLQEIEVLDRQWQSSGEEIAAKLTDDHCNKLLQNFQASFKDFAEIFVTDVYGLNICETNKTTDYYQADEDWWVQVFKTGKMYRQPGLEFDESAGVFAVPVYFPIKDPATRKVIGAAKAIVLEDRSTQ